MSSTRRQALRNIALSLTAAGLPAASAQHVHQHVAQAKAKTGVYKPRLFNQHEFATIRRLAELIIPADDVSGSAVEAGAPEFIDLIASHNEDLSTRLTGGIAWLDRFSARHSGKPFLEAAEPEQRKVLDAIAFRQDDPGELGPGIVFFHWVRRLTTDAFYTSPIGVKDLGYMGNKGMTVFQVPSEAIQYALKRSGL